MKRRNNRQTGFTLVECIAALVVLAVLAVFLVPALTRYIDEGREKQAVSEAQICVTSATEWAAKQRAALLAKAYAANTAFDKAYADVNNAALRWSGSYADLAAAAPTVTGGTVALTEGDGQYVLRPDAPTPDGTADDAMKAAVKAAAEVDGSVTAMQLNADGKVLYLLYTAANGTTVAYTAADTAQDPATTVPVAELPENKTPTPPTPDHSGDLVFCVLDEYTKQPVQGISFHVLDEAGQTVFNSQATDNNGMVYFALDPSDWNDHYKKFTLHPESWPVGYQQVFDVQFNIDAQKSAGSSTFDSYIINGIEKNTNHSTYKYKDGTVGTLDGGAERHLYTFYVRSVPTLELRVRDKDTDNYVENVNFTISHSTQSETITSGLTDTVFYVKLHDEDNLPTAHDFIDLSINGSRGDWSVKCNSVPDGYRSFNPFYLKIELQNRDEHEDQLYTELRSQGSGSTNTTCYNDYEHNRYIVTIPVISAATVTIQKTNDLGQPVSGAELKLETQDASGNRSVVKQWTTDESGTKSFPLTAGTYCLTETNAPDGYTAAKEQTFTVTDNTPLTVELVNHKINTDKDDVTIQDSVTVTFNDAENWAHKLTSDAKIKFKHEILFWKGKYYYAIPETDEHDNPYKQQWENKTLDLNADTTPDPQQWFKDNADKTLSPYVITLTGKIWTQADLKNKVSAGTPLQCGDLYWYEKDGKGKLYLYYGENVTDRDNDVITNAAGNNPPDSTNGGTATELAGKVWASINENKYTINTTPAP